jgi:hypothetical protein
MQICEHPSARITGLMVVNLLVHPVWINAYKLNYTLVYLVSCSGVSGFLSASDRK